MLAKEVMTKKAEYLSPEVTLKEAAALMKSHDYGFIPIGLNDKLVGAITDRDIAIRAVALGKGPATTAKEVMTEGIQYCFEDEDLKAVAEKMEQLKIRRLVVLNKDKRMTGIISLGDIATKSHDADLLFEVTEEISKH